MDCSRVNLTFTFTFTLHLPLQNLNDTIFNFIFLSTTGSLKGRSRAAPALPIEKILIRRLTRPDTGRYLHLNWSLELFGSKINMKFLDNSRHRPPLPFGKYSWYSFMLEVESTPVKNSNDTIGN